MPACSLLLLRCCNSAVSAYTHTYQSSFTKGAASFRQRLAIPVANQRRRPLSSCAGAGAIRRTTPTMMPEGPEVRTLVDQLQPAVGMRLADLRFLSGRYVRHGRPKGFDDFCKTMTPIDKSLVNKGKSNGDEAGDIDSASGTDDGDMLARALTTRDEVDVVTEWKAKGKFIYMVLDDGNASAVTGDIVDNSDYLRSIWITLGMSGRFVSETANSAANYMQEYGNGVEDGARWYMDFCDPTTERTKRIYYHDTRNFGTLRFSLSESELTKKLSTLGLDILDSRTTVEGYLAVIDRTKPTMNICKFLMDQKKISGVGNYILAEGLYRANIDPFACLSELSEQQKRTLFDELQATAQLSYASQGLTRQKGGSYRTPDGQRGKFEFNLQCYGQDKCPRGRPVLREMDGPHGRTIHYVESQLFVPRSMRGPKGEILDTGTPPSTTARQAKKPRIGKDVASLLDGSSNAVSGDRATVGSVNSNLVDGITDPGWKEAVSDWTSSPNFADLADFVRSERESGVEIYPPENEVFSALNLCPLDKVKVVIVGQDPYHGPGQGHGLAFSVKPGVRPPPSLQNVFREATDDVGIEAPRYGYLKSWAEQGVLCLNSVLTVRRGQANSHARKGWEQFTDEIINTLNTDKEGLVFLLWGGPAQKKAASVDESRHTVIKTSHPSPLGATKTSSPFLGSRCFSRTNKALVDAGMDPIDWNVE
eukprot:CAMPEP_0181023782 /NCGR_PEP_ID=MMETSP1070-20121207/2225_1 /TAXON_ID=265543 /ORGANISM="Minutocellus polymorphus, Strain NH13" /LENGTH=704 /DNA_ID=CAMNT_0023100801 /DNA_START=202 /DNA_END=2316 /DNA_ORIENTATION=+